MTNKIPVVGEIYKTKKGKVCLGHKDSEVLSVNKALIWYFQNPTMREEYYHYEIVTIDRFWRTHEELVSNKLLFQLLKNFLSNSFFFLVAIASTIVSGFKICKILTDTKFDEDE
jgi:hypothetical protein